MPESFRALLTRGEGSEHRVATTISANMQLPEGDKRVKVKLMPEDMAMTDIATVGEPPLPSGCYCWPRPAQAGSGGCRSTSTRQALPATQLVRHLDLGRHRSHHPPPNWPVNLQPPLFRSPEIRLPDDSTLHTA